MIVKFGIFGTQSVEVDENGFVELPVIVQESGLYAGVPPVEMRIVRVGMYGEDEFNKQYTAYLNRNRDLPYYLTSAKIKVVGEMVEWTDAKLVENGISPLEP